MEDFDFNRASMPELANYLAKAVSKSETLGNDWAKAKSQYDFLEDMKKPKLAKIGDKYRNTTQGERERLSLADPEYEDFLTSLSEARQNFLEKLVCYEAAKVRVEALRSLISARKEEVKVFRG